MKTCLQDWFFVELAEENTIFCPQEKNGLNHDHYKCSGYRKPIDGCENPHYIKNPP